MKTTSLDDPGDDHMNTLFVLAVRCMGGEDLFVSRQDVEPADDEWMNQAVKTGLLTPSAPSLYFHCDGCPDSPCLHVISLDDVNGVRKHYIHCPECGVVNVKARDLDRWKINKVVMMKIIGESLERFDYQSDIDKVSGEPDKSPPK